MSNSILWLASWYPNALSPLEGDFIQRHARAAALLNNITVIFIKKDDKATITKHTKTETTTTGNLTEIIIYYHPPTMGIRFANRLISQIKYNRIFRQALQNQVATNGVPRLLHVHVALHVTRQALWLRRKFRIPIIVSEHWTGYLEEAAPNLDDYHPLYKKLLQRLFKEAAAITTVSAFLGYAIKKRFKIPQPVVIAISPPFCPFVRSRTTLATTPLPRRITIMVPMASATSVCMPRQYSRGADFRGAITAGPH